MIGLGDSVSVRLTSVPLGAGSILAGGASTTVLTGTVGNIGGGALVATGVGIGLASGGMGLGTTGIASGATGFGG